MAVALKPEQGFVGNAALREAATTELRTIINMVRDGIAKRLYPTEKYPYVNIVSIFSDNAVAEHKGKYFSFSYSINDANELVLGEPAEVVQDWKPVSASSITEAWDDVAEHSFIEAKSSAKKGTKWLVTVIQSGVSKNGNKYGDALLKESVKKGLFDNVRVFNKSDLDHLKGAGKSVDNLIGSISNAKFVEGKKANTGRVVADLNLLEASGIATKLVELYERKMHGLFGFSIDADGKSKKHPKFREATQITHVNSLDLIVEPSAGGQVDKLIESVGETTVELEELIRFIEAKHPTALVGVDRHNKDAVVAVFDSLLREASASNDNDNGNVDIDVKISEAVAKNNAERDAQQALINQINATKLNDDGKAFLREAVVSGSITANSINDNIKRIAGLQGVDADSGKVNVDSGADGLGGHYRNYDDGLQLLEAYWDQKNNDVTSIREVYQQLTGDKNVTGMTHNCSRTRMAEALDSASLPYVMATALRKYVKQIYGDLTKYQLWRKVFEVVRADDFKSIEIVQWGGYGDLQQIAEGGAYPYISEPTDSKNTYAVNKYGGLAKGTLEGIKNDSNQVWSQLPSSMSRSAARTLSKFMWSIVTSNPNLASGKSLAHADHNNLFTAAITLDELIAHQQAMVKQLEMDTGEQLEIEPKFILTNLSNELSARKLFNLGTNNEPTAEQQATAAMEVLRIPGWTETNDWMTLADPMELAVFQAAFLDGNEEPEIFIQDAQTSGQVFTNDVFHVKARHIYGGCAHDHRGITRASVA